MVKQVLFVLASLALVSVSLAGSCVNPEINVKTFTNDDATVLTHIAFISEFSLSCKEGENFYALFGENFLPVTTIGDKTYQVSWFEDITTAYSGNRYITLYDEDGYAAYRKALRANEDVSKVQTIAQLNVYHPGAFGGPWLKSEFIAAALSVIVAYIAFSSRSKLLA